MYSVFRSMYQVFYEFAYNLYIYAYLVILSIIVILVIYIKLRYPFWSSQPVYHTYDFFRWIYLMIAWKHIDPYIIQSKVIKTRFVSLDKVITIPYTDLSSVQESEFVDLLQCHSFSSESIMNILDKTTIQSLLIGMSYVSFFQEDRLSIDLSNNAIVVAKKDTIGCMSSRPIQCIVSGIKTPGYFWDHICVNRSREKDGKIPRKNIAYKMIQTHEYRQRLMQPNVAASVFKKEGFKPTKNSIRTADSYSSWSMTDKYINPSPKGADLNLQRFNLCDGVVPLVKFQILTFELHKISKPPLPLDMTVVSINADDVYDMIYGFSHSNIFTLCMFPEIGSLIELIRTQIMHVYALKQGGHMLAVYFLKDTQIVYELNTENAGKLLECIASVDFENSPYFFAGFLGALYNVLEIGGKMEVIRFPNLGHNSKIIEKWRWKYSPISEIPAAYYIYNMIVPQMPIAQNKSLILI